MALNAYLINSNYEEVAIIEGVSSYTQVIEYDGVAYIFQAPCKDNEYMIGVFTEAKTESYSRDDKRVIREEDC